MDKGAAELMNELPSQPAKPVGMIGIIGDVHGEAEALSSALAHLSGVDCILCTGDVIDGTGSADACAELLSRHEVITVAGNHERWLFTNKMRKIANADNRSDLSLKTLSFLGGLLQSVELMTASGRLLLSHGVARNDMSQVWPGSDRLAPQKSNALDALLASKRYRYIVQGHIHYRMVLEFKQMTLINAGALKRNMNPAFMPGFMVLDATQKTLECFHMNEAGALVEKASIPLAEGSILGRVWKNTQEFDANWTVFRMDHYMESI